MESKLLSSHISMFNREQAFEMEHEVLGDTSSDVADAFRAITSMVVE